MSENSEKNRACGGEKRINCEFEDCVHAGKDNASEKHREPAYIVRKDHGDIIAKASICCALGTERGGAKPARARHLTYLSTFVAMPSFILRCYLVPSTPRALGSALGSALAAHRIPTIADPPCTRPPTLTRARLVDSLVRSSQAHCARHPPGTRCTLQLGPSCVEQLMEPRTCRLVLVWKGSRTPLYHFSISLLYLANRNPCSRCRTSNLHIHPFSFPFSLLIPHGLSLAAPSFVEPFKLPFLAL